MQKLKDMATVQLVLLGIFVCFLVVKLTIDVDPNIAAFLVNSPLNNWLFVLSPVLASFAVDVIAALLFVFRSED